MDLDKLYREYFGQVYRCILAICGDQHLAEEIIQETFFKSLKKIDTFRGESNIRVWLCQIAKNQYFTHLKKVRYTDSLYDSLVKIKKRMNMRQQITALVTVVVIAIMLTGAWYLYAVRTMYIPYKDTKFVWENDGLYIDKAYKINE